MKKTFIAVVAGTLLSAAGWVSASEPVQLTENQMDSVSAGGFKLKAAGGIATGGASTWGPGLVYSKSTVKSGNTWAYANNTSAAAGLFGATATSFAAAGAISVR